MRFQTKPQGHPHLACIPKVVYFDMEGLGDKVFYLFGFALLLKSMTATVVRGYVPLSGKRVILGKMGDEDREVDYS